MRRTKFIILLLVFLSSCYNTCVVPLNCPRSKNAHELTTYTYFWGLVKDDHLNNSKCTDCKNLGFSRVSVQTNFGYILCSVVTLGMVVPTHIIWECAVPPPVSTSAVPAGYDTSSAPVATPPVIKDTMVESGSKKRKPDPCP